MTAYIISDKDYQTETFFRLDKLVDSCLKTKGFEIEHKAIEKQKLTNCMGCFGCWIKEPGKCVIKDDMDNINNNCMNSDVVVYLSPVIFGQFSANIKNAIDRWLPNMLPFFTTRKDGSTIHPPRYQSYPKQFMIGYGDIISGEDERLFIDITKKHRTNVEALVFHNVDTEIRDIFDNTKLERIGGEL